MSIKEWFKSKPIWLRGGLISLLSVIILLLVYIITQSFVEGNLIDKPALFPIFIPIFIISAPLLGVLAFLGFFVDFLFHTGAGYMSLQTLPGGQAIILVIVIAYYFLIGALIGLIIGKIKSKK